MKEIIACLLCLMLLPTHAAAQETTTLKEKVIAIPVGEFVEIRTIDKTKIRGRMGAATNDAVTIDTIRTGQPETVRVEFTSVKSIRITSPVEPSTGGKIASNTGKGLLAALAVVGGILLVAGLIIGG